MATDIKLKRSNKKFSVSDNLENAPQRYYKILAKMSHFLISILKDTEEPK